MHETAAYFGMLPFSSIYFFLWSEVSSLRLTLLCFIGELPTAWNFNTIVTISTLWIVMMSHLKSKEEINAHQIMPVMLLTGHSMFCWELG